MATKEYATFEELHEAFEGTIPDEAQSRVEGMLRRASAKLTALVPSLPARVDAGEVDPELPRGMVIDVVLDRVRNPTGAKSQTAGPFGYVLTDSAANARFTFADDDLALLAPPEPVGLRSVPLAIPSWRVP